MSPRGMKAREMATDRQLIKWLKGRHADSALSELLKRYGPMVRRTALRVAGCGDAADDVGQAVFLLLVDKSGGLGGVRSTGALLHRLAAAAARAWLKSEAPRARRAKPTEEPATPTLHEKFDRTLDGLPGDSRNLLVTRFLRGLAPAASAAELGIAEDELDARLSRAVRRLRSALRSGPDLEAALAAEADAAAAPGALSAAHAAAITQAALGEPRTTVRLMARRMGAALLWSKLKMAAGLGP